jgi:hypothetical protein
MESAKPDEASLHRVEVNPRVSRRFDMRILDLSHFLQFQGNRLVKVLRHRDTKTDLWALLHEGTFEDYQNTQSWDVFGSARFVISFIAERYNYAKFVGVWEVTGKARNPSGRGFRYTTRKLDGFDDLTARLIVRWGDGTRSWAQWLHRKGNKEVSEMLPPDYVMEFPGYYDFQLSYAQLQQMVNNPDSNREWQRMLSSVSGVYIILDRESGNQYVGSAYGKGGIWGRWKTYAKNPSGGNKLIKELLRIDPGRRNFFQFAILRVLEPACTKDQVIAQECIIKSKLGSRAFGLNEN